MAKNRVLESSKQLPLMVPSGTLSGDPVASGLIVGVAVIDRQLDGRATVDTGGTYLLNVNAVDGSGNSPVNEGDQLYFTVGDTVKLSKKATGVPFGKALQLFGAGSPAGPVLTNPVLATGTIGIIHVKVG